MWDEVIRLGSLSLYCSWWTSSYTKIWEKDNFILMVPQIKLQRSSWSKVPWASALVQGGRWHHYLSLWYSLLFFLWWPLTRSSIFSPQKPSTQIIRMAAGMLKGFCPQSVLNFLSLFLEIYWVICWEEKIALTAPKTAHVCPTMMLLLQMEQLPPFLQGSYLVMC